ncbi:MAG: type II toxin-antitoxin system prevent-host-death family antitoxin [Candidatus Sumerlaeia bacterium]|nr:type II toxin-antitoxin system prevent-host-death family antitoxin [Candidatus Sumerlaeia bacterium]
MKLTFLDLRRDPGKLLDAVERGEAVTLSRRGRDIARVVPAGSPGKAPKVADHPAFGMWAEADTSESPAALVRRMRRGRFHGL